MDVAVVGQGEDTFVEIARGWTAESRSPVVAERWCKDGAVVIAGPPRPLRDLNELPRTTTRSFRSRRYFAHKGRRQVDYISSQGCRFRCAFCADPAVYRRAWTGLAPERVADEVVDLSRRYGMEELAFQDETFFTHARTSRSPRRRVSRTWPSRGMDRDAARRSGVPHGRGALCQGRAIRTAPRDGRRRSRVAGDARSAGQGRQRRTGHHDRGALRAPRRRRHLQLHRRFSGRIRRQRRRHAGAGEAPARHAPALRDADLLLPAVSGQSTGRRRSRQRLCVSGRPRRRGPTSTTWARAARGSRRLAGGASSASSSTRGTPGSRGNGAGRFAPRHAGAASATGMRFPVEKALVELVRRPEQVS